MSGTKEFRFVIRRISYNRFLVKNREFDYLQLVNWFKVMVTE